MREARRAGSAPAAAVTRTRAARTVASCPAGTVNGTLTSATRTRSHEYGRPGARPRIPPGTPWRAHSRVTMRCTAAAFAGRDEPDALLLRHPAAHTASARAPDRIRPCRAPPRGRRPAPDAGSAAAAAGQRL
ncbi:hypothetical protein GCM10010478_18970 [Streptomyces erythrogriseus]|uniref:Uncharacterized protein n=1 Tax=Streptomyces erythrogriseus TaxID=284027 RepID=A0ABN3WLQ0_9ACTN